MRPPQILSIRRHPSLNESPSEKEGKFRVLESDFVRETASMKAPPKRKGNPCRSPDCHEAPGLNESPSEKEGKYSGKRLSF